MTHTINILLSSQRTVYSIEVTGLSSLGISSATKVDFTGLYLPAEQMHEQRMFLSMAADAAFASLNEVDKANKFRAIVRLKANTSAPISLEPNSVSVGLGYGIALGVQWHAQRGKVTPLTCDVFATGQVHPSGAITGIGHLSDKITAACHVAREREMSSFVLYYPDDNKPDITDSLRRDVSDAGGRLVSVDNLSNVLLDLYGESYDGLRDSHRKMFNGLERFTYADRARFFGRDDDVNRVLKDMGDHKIVIINGPSGAGKSSLIDAGIRPRLEKAGTLRYSRHTPSELPFDALLSWAAKQLGMSEDNLMDDRPIDVPHTIEGAESTLWVFDQVEELFVNTDEGTQKQWFACLCQWAMQYHHLRIIFCLRHEYVWRLDTLPCFRERTHKEIKVYAQLKPTQWQDIIELQAGYSGLGFEKGLVDTIVDEAIRTGESLPMVELVMTKLSEQVQGRMLRHADYKALGRLSGVIAQHAEETIAQLPKTTIDEGLSQVFASLITVSAKDEVGLPVLQYASMSAATSPAVQDIIDVFYQARLLVKHPSHPDSYHFVHDVLIKDWPRVSAWLKEYRPFLTWRYRIEPQFSAWHAQSDKDKKAWLLTKGALLSESLEWLKQAPEAIPSELALFIRNSKKALFTNRLSLSTFLISFIISFSAIAYIYFSNTDERQKLDEQVEKTEKIQQELAETALAFNEQSIIVEEQQRQVEQQTKMAEFASGRLDSEVQQKLKEQSRFLSRASKEENIKGNHDLAMLLAMNALPGKYGGERPLVNEALDQLYISNHKLEKTARYYHSSPITNAAFSHDGGMVATSSEDKTTIIWSTATGEVINVFQHESIPTLVEFNPNGTSLITYEIPPNETVLGELALEFLLDNPHVDEVPYNISIWSLIDGERIQFHHRRVREILFSPNGNSFLLKGRTTIHYSSETGEIIGDGNNGTGTPLGVFSQDGSQLLLGGGFTTLYRRKDMKVQSYMGIAGDGNFSAIDLAPYANHYLAARSNVLRVMSLYPKKVTTKLTNSSRIIYAKFTPENPLSAITIDTERIIKRWSLGPIAKVEKQASLASRPLNMEFVNNGNFIMLLESTGRTLTLLNTSQFEVVKKWTFPEEIEFFKLSPDKKSFFIGMKGNNEIYSYKLRFHDGLFTLSKLGNNKRPWEISAHTLVHPNGQIIVATRNKSAKVFSNAGELIHDFKHDFELQHVDANPEGNLIVTTGSNVSTVWDTANNRIKETYKNEAYLSRSYISRDGKTVASIKSDTVFFWSVRTGWNISDIKFGKEVQQVAFSNDNKYLFVSLKKDTTVKQIDIEKGKEVHSYSAGNAVNTFDYDPNSEQLLIASTSKIVYLWSATNKQYLHKFSHPSMDVKSVEFYPKLGVILTMNADNVTIWSATDYSIKNTIDAPYAKQFAIANVSSDGKKLFTLSNDSGWGAMNHQRIDWSLLTNTILNSDERTNSYTGFNENDRQYLALRVAGLFNDDKQHYTGKILVVWRSVDTSISVDDANRILPLNRKCLTSKERLRFSLLALNTEQKRERGCQEIAAPFINESIKAIKASFIAPTIVDDSVNKGFLASPSPNHNSH